VDDAKEETEHAPQTDKGIEWFALIEVAIQPHPTTAENGEAVHNPEERLSNFEPGSRRMSEVDNLFLRLFGTHWACPYFCSIH
jgi:hypothetical protein